MGPGEAHMFVEDLMNQLEIFADVEAVDTSRARGDVDAQTLARISEEHGLDMPSKEVAEAARESVQDPEAEKLNDELLAQRKADLIGKTITGRLKVSHMGARKGYFIKWNEHDNDTIYVSKARAEQHLGPNPRQGMWVKCTIIDLGPAWAPWDRQHPFTQAIVAEDSPRSRQPSQRPMRPAPLSRENSNSMLLTSTSRNRLESTRSAGCTPSPRTAAQAAKSWKLIQQALYRQNPGRE